MASNLKVYIGYDSREDIAFEVCKNSILERSTSALEIYAVRQDRLRELGLYTRAIDPDSATEFSVTRFLTPYLADHAGWTIFVDCDFIFTVDITSILRDVRRDKGVYVVPHDYSPRYEYKMDGKRQCIYPRKNWSSFMVFNGEHARVKKLTPRIVNTESPSYLHRLRWIPDDEIGELPLTWNYLVGEYEEPSHPPNAIHFTNGGPWFDQWQNVMYADLWREERDRYLSKI